MRRPPGRTAARVLAIGILALIVGAGPALACLDVGPGEMPSGRWEGVITGRELAQSTHISDVPVALSIHPDGRWEISTALGDSAGAVTRVAGDSIELEGHLGGAQGPPVWHRMTCWQGRDLVGQVQTQFSGRTVVTTVILRRVQASRATGGGTAVSTEPRRTWSGSGEVGEGLGELLA